MIIMFRGNKYVRTVIDADKFLTDCHNTFRVCSKRAYKGKTDKGIPAGTTFDLQVMVDDSESYYDKNGNLIENNLLEIFQATIPGHDYASSTIKKGDVVALGKLMEEISYYIDFNLILRFDGITKLQPPKNEGGNRQ